MKWTPEKVTIAEAILRHRREDGSYDFNAVKAECGIPDKGKSGIARVAQELRANDWQLPEEKGIVPERKGVGDSAFEPSGQATSKQTGKWIDIGTLRMPLEDWGYSSTLNLLKVAQTYEDFKSVYGFQGKVGDCCALLCEIFRCCVGWNTIGEPEPAQPGSQLQPAQLQAVAIEGGQREE